MSSSVFNSMDAPLDSQPTGSRNDAAMLSLQKVCFTARVEALHRHTESINPDVQLHVFWAGDGLDDVTAAGREFVRGR